MPLRRALLTAAVAAVTTLAACADRDIAGPPGQCQVTEAAHMTLERSAGLILAPGRINGTEVAMVVDTGSERSLVAAGIITRLGLLSDPRHGTLVSGVGSQGRAQNDVLVDQFEFGGFDPKEIHYTIGDFPVPTKSAPLGGIVGAEVLSHFDLDLDLAHKTLTLYTVRHCSGRFLPWSGPYTAIPLDIDWSGMLALPVRVNGHELRARLDTGSSATTIDSSAAERIGLTSDMLAADKSGQGFGAAGVNFKLASHQFDELQVGDERVANPRLQILDRPLRHTDVLLGLDYLRGRRVWISYRTQQLFVAPRTQ